MKRSRQASRPPRQLLDPSTWGYTKPERTRMHQRPKKPSLREPVVIGEKPVGREALRVYLDEYRGRHSLHVRRFYQGDDGELHPGKGAAIPAHLIPFVRQAIIQAEQAALEAGLLSEEDFELAGRPLPAALGGEADVAAA